MPHVELKDNGNLWSRFSKEEAKTFLQGEGFGKMHPSRLFVRGIIEKIGRGKSLLDVPCGSGVDYEVLGDICSYTGLDKTKVLTEAVSEHYGVPTVIGDIRNMPLGDGSVDIVLARAIFEHLPSLEDTKMAIDECIRVAKEHVILAFYIPLGNETKINWNGYYYENRYSMADIKAILDLSGLPYEWHHVDVSGTQFVDSYDIFHLKKVVTETEPKKRGRPKKKA